MTKDEAIRALDRLEVLSKGFGAPDDAALRESRQIIFTFRCGPLQRPYFREKLSKLEGYANEGFSSRKFGKYHGGAEQVRVWALGALDSARSEVEEHWPS